MASGFLVVLEAGRARTEKRDVELVADDVTRLVLLTDLRISLLEERNWRIATSWLNVLPFDSLAIDAVDVDIEQEMAESTERVDHLVTTLQLATVSEVIDQVRISADGSTLDISDAYGDVEALVAGESDLVLNRLMTNGGNVNDGGRLISAIRVLEATATARQALSAETNYFFALQFAGQTGLGDSLGPLVIEQSTRRRALNDIDRVGPVGSAVDSTLELIGRSPEIEIYEQSTARFLAVASGTGAAAESSAPMIGLINESLRITSGATDLYLNLVNSAGADALDASAALQAAAIRRDQRALGSLTLLIISTTLLAWFAYRSLLAPISDLALRAQQVRDGRTNADAVPLTGPIEIRQATSAINEAADQLRLAERQATALAAGDLGHSSLDQPILGELGASLQRAVRTLASSLSEREDFRRRMTYEATHDGLTQLSNRRAAMARPSTTQRGRSTWPSGSPRCSNSRC